MDYNFWAIFSLIELKLVSLDQVAYAKFSFSKFFLCEFAIILFKQDRITQEWLKRLQIAVQIAVLLVLTLDPTMN